MLKARHAGGREADCFFLRGGPTGKCLRQPGVLLLQGADPGRPREARPAGAGHAAKRLHRRQQHLLAQVRRTLPAPAGSHKQAHCASLLRDHYGMRLDYQENMSDHEHSRPSQQQAGRDVN